jgi:hypothetical protein
MERPSRIEATRRKLRLARYVVVASSAAAFGTFALVARADHAGKSTSASSTAVVSQSSGNTEGDDFDSQSFDYGNSSVAPSDNSAPLVQSSGS